MFAFPFMVGIRSMVAKEATGSASNVNAPFDCSCFTRRSSQCCVAVRFPRTVQLALLNQLRLNVGRTRRKQTLLSRSLNIVSGLSALMLVLPDRTQSIDVPVVAVIHDARMQEAPYRKIPDDGS